MWIDCIAPDDKRKFILFEEYLETVNRKLIDFQIRQDNKKNICYYILYEDMNNGEKDFSFVYDFEIKRAIRKDIDFISESKSWGKFIFSKLEHTKGQKYLHEFKKFHLSKIKDANLKIKKDKNEIEETMLMK